MTVKEGIIKLRKDTFDILDKPNEDAMVSKANVIVNWFLVVLISLNVLAVVVSTVGDYHDRYQEIFTVFEVFSIAIFTLEYVLRLWTAPCKFNKVPNNEDTEINPKEAAKKENPYLKYIFSGMAIVDLLVILPFYLPFIFGFDLRILRLFRLVRILRILKLIRYNRSLGLITKVLKNEKEKLYIAFVFIIILVLVSSSVLYFLENAVQPDKFPNIPATLWWAVATLTTVGYGDVYPITNLGKVLAGFISILAIGMVGLPTAIISSGFINQLQKGVLKYNPRDVHDLLEYVENLREKIDNVLDAVVKELGNKYAIGYHQKDKLGQGTYLYFNKNKDCLWCGLSTMVEVEGNEKYEYSYSFGIWEKYVDHNLLEKINKNEFPWINGNDGWIYVKIDSKLFQEGTANSELQKIIVKIIKEVFLKVVKEEFRNKDITP